MGEPQPVFGLGAGYPSIRGNLMVYQQITRSRRPSGGCRGRQSVDAQSGTAEADRLQSGDGNAAYSPDGRRIAFESSRSGVGNIWVCDSDGTNPVQLTTFEGHAGTPRWSPDGRKLVFDSIEAGDWNLYVVDADGGAPRRLTPESSDDNVGTWSRDGRWIYFSSNRGGSKQIWKIPSAGGPAVQVTRGGGFYAQESWDGRHLYYTNAKIPPESGECRLRAERKPKWCEGPSHGGKTGLSPGAASTTRRFGQEAEAASTRSTFLDFGSGRTTEVFRQVGSSGMQWLTVSPDEEWILYSEWPETQSELMLVENFR